MDVLFGKDMGAQYFGLPLQPVIKWQLPTQNTRGHMIPVQQAMISKEPHKAQTKHKIIASNSNVVSFKIECIGLV
jgi:hypothetical protein